MNYWFLIFIITSTYRNNEDIMLLTVPESRSSKQQGYAISMCEWMKSIIRAPAVFRKLEYEYTYYFWKLLDLL